MSCRVENFFNVRKVPNDIDAPSPGSLRRGLDNLNFDTISELNVPNRNFSAEFNNPRPPSNEDATIQLTTDITNLNRNLDEITIKRKNPDGTDNNLSIDDALDQTESLPDDMIDIELDNAARSVDEIEVEVNNFKSDLKKLKRKAGVDVDSGVMENETAIKNSLGDESYNQMSDLETKINGLEMKINNSRNQIQIKRDSLEEMGDAGESRFTSSFEDGNDYFGEFKFRVEPKDPDIPGANINLDGKLPNEVQLTEIKKLIKAELNKYGAIGLDDSATDLKRSINDIEETPTRKAERARNIARTQANLEANIGRYASRAEPPGIKRNKDGTEEFTGIDEDAMDPPTRGVYNKLCDYLGFKRKGTNGAASKNDPDYRNSTRTRKQYIYKLLKYLVFAGLFFYFFQNLADCMLDGELGPSSTESHTDKGRCDEITKMILGEEGDNKDALNDSESPQGARVSRIKIRAYHGRNRNKPFLIRNYETFDLDTYNMFEVGTQDHRAGFVEYPDENTRGINQFTLPYYNPDEKFLYEGIETEDVENCSIEVSEDGIPGNENVSGCPSSSDNKPIILDDSESNISRWKKHNDGDECTIKYTIHQSALECSIENILSETIRDLGELTGSMLKATGEAVGKGFSGAGEGVWAFFDQILGPLGGFGMTIVYIICGIICLLILFKLYKKFTSK